MPERCGSHWRVNINRIPDKETLFARKYLGAAVRFFSGFGDNVLIYYYLCSHSLKIIV